MIFLYLLTSSIAFSGIIFDAVKPLETKLIDLAPSEYIEDKTQVVRLKCDLYPKMAIQTVMDPGLKGTNYKIVVRTKGTKTDELCSSTTKLRSFNIHAGDLTGIANDIMVVTGEEPLGNVDHLIFYDIKSGAQIHSLQYDVSQPVTIKKSGKSLSLNYHAFLGGPRENCNVVADKTTACLNKILVRNQVSNPKSFSVPDCSVSIKFNPKDALAGSVDLFLEATIADVRKPKVKFKGKKIVCSLAP